MKFIIICLIATLNYSAFAAKKGSPFRMATSLTKFQSTVDTNMPSMTYEQLLKAFKYVRDTKFFDRSSMREGIAGPDKRRIPWLYIDIGCQVRAHKSIIEIDKKFGELPFKTVFVFQKTINKKLKNQSFTAYHDLLGYKMTWDTFHVALAAKVGDQVYMIDPPFDFEKPIKFEDWRKQLVENINESAVKYALCDPYARNTVGKWSCTIGDRYSSEEYIRNEMMGGFNRFGRYFEGYLQLEYNMLKKGILEGKYNNDINYYLGDVLPWEN